MKLEQQLKERIRAQGKSSNTFKTYWGWCYRFLVFVRDQNGGEWIHPKTIGRVEVEMFLSWLANKQHVSPNTQNIALQSLCYLYREVIRKPLENVNAIRAKRPTRTREVLSVREVALVFGEMSGRELLAAQLMYGCGLRIGEIEKLRIKDISFDRCQLHIRDGKGYKDRLCSFPEVIHESVRRQIESVRRIHADDLKNRRNGISLPFAWRRKSPKSALDFGWYFLFASHKTSHCPETGECLRHHMHRSTISRSLGNAARQSGVHKRVTSHILRHCYATHANESGVSIRSLQELLGHSDIRTTEIYLYVNQNEATSQPSPLTELLESNKHLRVVG